MGPASNCLDGLQRRYPPDRFPVHDRPVQRRCPPVALRTRMDHDGAPGSPDLDGNAFAQERADHEIRVGGGHGSHDADVVGGQLKGHLVTGGAQLDPGTLAQAVEGRAQQQNAHRTPDRSQPPAPGIDQRRGRGRAAPVSLGFCSALGYCQRASQQAGDTEPGRTPLDQQARGGSIGESVDPTRRAREDRETQVVTPAPVIQIRQPPSRSAGHHRLRSRSPSLSR